MKSIKLIRIALTGAFLMTALSACSSGEQTVTVTTEAPAETSAANTEVFKSSEIKVLGRLYQLEKTAAAPAKKAKKK